MKKEKALSELLPGEWANVSSVRTAGDMRRRFLDIGLIPKTRVSCLGASPLGDPRAYYIRGKTVAIRQADASLVGISERESEPSRERKMT